MDLRGNPGNKQGLIVMGLGASLIMVKLGQVFAWVGKLDLNKGLAVAKAKEGLKQMRMRVSDEKSKGERMA